VLSYFAINRVKEKKRHIDQERCDESEKTMCDFVPHHVTLRDVFFLTGVPKLLRCVISRRLGRQRLQKHDGLHQRNAPTSHDAERLLQNEETLTGHDMLQTRRLRNSQRHKRNVGPET
jgi:hypothetical protein